MSFKQYLVLLLMFLAYMVLGAYMFYSVERPLEERRRALAKAEALEIRELLRNHYAQGLPQAHMELLSRLSDYCGKPFFIDSIPLEDTTNDSDTNPFPDVIPEEDPFDEKPILWTFYNSFLFVMCTLSTIGYGNLAPTSRHSRILDVIYGLIGIPFTGIVLAQMAEYFGSLFMRAHHRYKSHEYQTRTSLIADILTYTVLGMIIFIFFPATIFIYFEDWTFDTGVYYAFTTLATIGYGDLVAGQNQTNSWVYTVYKIMVLVWIIFGLGYMLMIVGFLTRVMRSKKVRKIEHKLANTIKATHSKIWNEFSQDVTYLRRMLNEMYLLKIQPVYVEKESEEGKEGVRRVKSCPNLTEWPVLRKKQEVKDESEDEEEMAEKFRRIAMRRRKGNAENLMAPRITKTVSEGDLSRIDRKATFGDDAGSVEPKLLLARVVDALGTSVGSKFSLDDDCGIYSRKVSIQPNGIHGFSDEEILASERLPSRWSLGGRKQTPTEQLTPEARTWGGVNPVDIQKFIRMRANGELRRRSSQTQDTRSISSYSRSSISDHSLKVRQSRMRRMSMAVTNLFSHTNKNKPQEGKDLNKELRDSKKKRRTGNTPLRRSNKRLSLPDDEDTQSVVEQVNYLSQTGGRRSSVFAALANELTTTAVAGNVPVSPVLEQTSVADFLRLLSSLQAKMDPTLSLPPENHYNQFTNRRKSSVNPPKDTVANSLAMLFSSTLVTSQATGPQQSTGGPAELPHQGNRRISIFTKAPNFLEVSSNQGRRFSLIPPMDVDHPSGQTNLQDIKLKRRSSSSHNMFQHSDAPAVNLPGAVSRPRAPRASLTGTAKYISSKLQGSSDAQKSGQPNTTTSEGFRKFLVRPVSASDKPLTSDVKTSLPVPVLQVPTITVENVDGEPTRDEQDEDSLQDVVVVRL